VSRITLFEAPEDEAAFVAAWRAGDRPGARLLRSHSEGADHRFAELAPTDVPAPRLPARAASARYQVVRDDLPVNTPFDLVFINPYEVPPAEDEAFIAEWTSVRNLVKGRPGYVGSHLNRSIDDDAEFRFVNVSPWASVSAFTAAVTDPAFAQAARTIYHRAHPSLYVPVR
jgi:heme-degrading monooxygenase HmoA